MKLTHFKGLMAPVFTPFIGDVINYEIIPKYIEFLKSMNIRAVLVNGTSGEAMSLSVVERKRVTEKFFEACKHFDMLIMVQISGCSFADVIELARHAEQLGVHGVLCLPELYFKPKTVIQLVEYIKNIAFYCPNTSIYYYHIPMFTQVDLSMSSFMELATKEIKTFRGIKYTSGDLDKGLACLQYGQVFLGADTILCGALALGFECAIMTSLNMHPEMSLKVIEYMNAGKVVEARAEQKKLNEYISKALKDGEVIYKGNNMHSLI